MDTIKKLSFPDSIKLIKEAIKKEKAIDELVLNNVCEEREAAVKAVNKLLFDIAEKQNVSLYTLCFNTIPNYKREWNMEKNMIEWAITIDPIPFDFEHDGGYWKNKYYELKKQIQEIIDAK